MPTPSGGARRSRRSRLAAWATHRISSVRSCFLPRTNQSGRPAARSPSTAAITRSDRAVSEQLAEFLVERHWQVARQSDKSILMMPITDNVLYQKRAGLL